MHNKKITASQHRSVISNGQSLYQHPSDLPVQAGVLANKLTNLPDVWYLRNHSQLR